MANHKRKENPSRVRACYAPDHSAALQMVAVLKSHGIDASAGGGVKDIYQVGGELIGEEILVPPEALAQALDLLNQMTGSDQTAQRPSKSVGRSLIGLGAAAILLVVLLILRGFLL